MECVTHPCRTVGRGVPATVSRVTADSAAGAQSHVRQEVETHSPTAVPHRCAARQARPHCPPLDVARRRLARLHVWHLPCRNRATRGVPRAPCAAARRTFPWRTARTTRG